jgi:hypothetical protein
MIKKIYTFGCSFTKDNYQKTWADLLSDRLQALLENRAERGAGSDFLLKRLFTSTDICPDDSLVVIMWPSADRFDLWTDASVPHLVNDINTASWPDGVQPKFIDYHGIYRVDAGFNCNGSVPRGFKHKWFKFFYSAHKATHDWYCNIISSQLYLQTRKIKYVMASSFPLVMPLHYHVGAVDIVPEIFDQIDQEKFVSNSKHQGFYGFCSDRNTEWFDKNHPKTSAHSIWVDDILIPKLVELSYIR